MKEKRLKTILIIAYALVGIVALSYVAFFVVPDMLENEKAANWPGYRETDYRYCHDTEREMLWEEDIIYLANAYLSDHPKLSGKDIYIHRYTAATESDLEYSNAMYDESAREEFIAGIEELIPQLEDLNDVQIIYELQRIVAGIGDENAVLRVGAGEFLPITLDALYEDGASCYYAVTVPAECENALFGKLTAINGIGIEEVVERMMPYLSCNTRYFADYLLVNFRSYSLLTDKELLQVTGVMAWEDDTAELTFDTDSGEVRCTVEAVTAEEYSDMDMITRACQEQDWAAWRYWKEQYTWYEVMEDENAVYLRIWRSYDTSIDFSKNLDRVAKLLRDAEKPMKLIIDFRSNNGGYEYESLYSNFIASVNRTETDGVYVVIDGYTFAHSLALADWLATEIEGGQLVGSPAGQRTDFYGQLTSHTLPNSDYGFYFGSEYYEMLPGDVELDVEVYQTVEDYKNGIDTVLEYILAIE